MSSSQLDLKTRRTTLEAVFESLGESNASIWSRGRLKLHLQYNVLHCQCCPSAIYFHVPSLQSVLHESPTVVACWLKYPPYQRTPQTESGRRFRTYMQIYCRKMMNLIQRKTIKLCRDQRPAMSELYSGSDQCLGVSWCTSCLGRLAKSSESVQETQSMSSTSAGISSSLEEQNQ